MSEVIVLDRPFLEVKQVLNKYISRDETGENIDMLKECGFEFGWLLPERTDDYMTQLKNASREGIVYRGEMARCKTGFDKYSRLITGHPDALVVVHRSDRFDLNLDVESALFSLILDNGNETYFFPQFSQRPFFERKGGFIGTRMTGFADILAREHFLDSHLNGKAEIIFAGTETSDMAYIAKKEYSTYMNTPVQIHSIEPKGRAEKEIKHDIELGIYDGYTLDDFVIIEDIS